MSCLRIHRKDLDTIRKILEFNSSRLRTDEQQIELEQLMPDLENYATFILESIELKEKQTGPIKELIIDDDEEEVDDNDEVVREEEE